MGILGLVLVRYRYRLYPSPGQRQSLARVFGCARVVYNDCLRMREECHAAGERISETDVQRRGARPRRQRRTEHSRRRAGGEAKRLWNWHKTTASGGSRR
jgi:Helix-turn-helix domain